MRYTRYNYRRDKNRRNKKNNVGFLFLGILCILLSVVVGTMLRPLVFGDAYKNPENAEKEGTITSEENKTGKEDEKKKEDESKLDGAVEKKEDVKETTNGDMKDMYMIQCGLYSKKEGAETILKKIPDNFNKFISEEDGKFRVIAGIYDDETSKKKIEELSKNDVESVRIRSSFNTGDNGAEIYSIIKGFIDILNKLEEEDVKSIKTNDFKEWTKNLSIKDENEEIKDIKKYISELPEELDKKGAEKSLDYIYKILIKHRV